MDRSAASTFPAKRFRLFWLVALLALAVLAAWSLIDCDQEVRIRIVGNPDGVTMALDQRGLEMLFGSQAKVPGLDQDGSQILYASPKVMMRLGSPHLAVLPTGTRLKSLDENILFNDDQLCKRNTRRDRGLTLHGPVELERVQVVSGPQRGSKDGFEAG